MADTCTGIQNPEYTALQASMQQQRPVYEQMYELLIQDPDRKTASSLQQSTEAAVPSNTQDVTNRTRIVGNLPFQKDQVILLILLTISALLNVVILIALFITQPSCPQPSCPQPSCPQPSCPQPSCPQPSCPQPSCPQPSCPQVTNTTQMTQSIVQEFLSLRSKDKFSSCDNITD